MLSAPRDLQVETIEAGTVSIQWSPPAVTNDDIQSYIILYSRTLTSGDDEWMSVTRDGSVLSTILDIPDTRDNMDGDEVYHFKMMARTQSGTGEITQPVSVNIAAVVVVTPDVHPTPAGNTCRLNLMLKYKVMLRMWCFSIQHCIIINLICCFKSNF